MEDNPDVLREEVQRLIAVAAIATKARCPELREPVLLELRERGLNLRAGSDPALIREFTGAAL